jgi:hypothetical protein
MSTINLRDARNRNAQVRAESVGTRSVVRHVGPDGEPVKLRKVLRATMEQDLEHLRADAGGEDKLGEALIAFDPEVDIERAGMFLTDPARVYVNERHEIVYQIEQTEVVRTPSGEEKERRPRRRAEPNVDTEIPISWTGRLMKKQDTLQRFVFASKVQVMHINGLTYDFLFAMAKELHDAGSLMLLSAGKSGKEPLIFRHGATPYRGFLEGRVRDDKYVLLLHLSNQELKRPAPVAEVAKEAPKESAEAAKPVAAVAEPASPKAVGAEGDAKPVEKAAKARKPTARKAAVADVVGEKATALAASGAKEELAPLVTKAKTTKTKASQAAIADKVAKGTAKDGAEPKPAPRKKAKLDTATRAKS